MKNNNVKKVTSILMSSTLVIGSIPRNLAYADTNTVITEEENNEIISEVIKEESIEDNSQNDDETIKEEESETIKVESIADNSQNNDENTKEKEDNIEVNSNNKELSNIIESIEIDSNNAYNGDDIKVSVKINDSELKNLEHIELYWENEDGNITMSSYLNNYNYNDKTGKIEGYINIWSSIEKSTTIKLKEAVIVNRDYNETQLSREELQNQGINLENLDINIDKWKPIIKSINISSNKILRGEKVKVEVEVDNSQKEDIKSIRVKWVDKENWNESILSDLEYNEKSGKFEGTTNIVASLDKNYEMIIDNIYVEKKGYVSEYLYKEDLKNQGINLDKLNLSVSEWKTTIKSVDISKKEITYPLDGFYSTDISVEIENSSEIESIHCWYDYDYKYKKYYNAANLFYNKSTGKFEGDYNFSPQQQSGKLSSLRIELKNGSYIEIKREDLSRFGIDSNSFDVNIKKVNVPFDINLSSKQIKAGETIKLSMDLGDYAESFKDINLRYMDDNRHDDENIKLKYNKDTKLYEGDFTPNKLSGDKVMSLQSMTLYGYNGGETYIWDLEEQFKNKASFKIVNIHNEIIENTISNLEFNINKNKFDLGEQLVFTAESKGSTIPTSIWVNLINKENQDEETMYLSYNSKTKKFEGVLNIDAGLSGGEWVVDNINLTLDNTYDNFVSIDIYNSELYDTEEYVKDFSSCNFKINSSVHDTTAPVFKGISVDKKQGTYGEKIKVSVDATDDISGIDEISIGIEGPDYRYLKLEYNKISNKYEGEITIDTGMVNGNYSPYLITMSDNAGNIVNIYGDEYDLSNGDFKVINTVDDLSDLIILATASKKTIVRGDTVDFEVKLKNNIMVNDIRLIFYRSDTPVKSEPYQGFILNYDEISKSYKGSFKSDDYYTNFDKDDVSFYLDHIVLNIGENIESSFSLDENLNNLNFNISDKINNDVNIISNSVDKNRATEGDTVNLSIEAEDAKNIKSMKAIYIEPNKEELEEIELKKDNNKFTGSLKIGKYSSPGKWKIYKIIVEDLNGDKTIIKNKNFDFISSEFEVYGTTLDNTSPKVLDIYADNKYITIGEKVKISIKAEDLESGIKNIKARFSSDENNSSYVEFTYNNSTDCYEYIMDTSLSHISGMKINDGRIVIDGIIVEDNVGNIRDYGWGDLEDVELYLYYAKEWFVNQIDNRSTFVDGYTQKNTRVNVNINNKVYTGISDSKGYFKIEIPKQKVDTKVVVDITANNNEILRSFTLNVIKNNSSNEEPVINASNVELKVGDTFDPKNGVSASDKEDGDITSRIVIKENTVNMSKIGTYKVVYEVTDNDKNTVTKEIKVIVKNNINLNSSDIKGHWAKDSILYAMDNGWVQMSEKFRPDDDITRAEFVKIVNKAFNHTEMVSEPYKDVKSTDWFYDEVRKGLAAGYLTPSDKFRPYDNITRQEAAKIIGSIMNLKGDGKMDFKDANKISSWAWDYVDGLSEKGIIKGNNGYFAPHNNLTRAEGVTILQRAKN